MSSETPPSIDSPFLGGLIRAHVLIETRISQLESLGWSTDDTIRGESSGDDGYQLDELEIFAQRLTQIIE